jgi:hypothetical protein
MAVISRWKRFVKLWQQQQAKSGYEWHRAKFITVWAMDLKPWEGLRPLIGLCCTGKFSSTLPQYRKDSNFSVSWVARWWSHWILCMMILLPTPVGFSCQKTSL